MSETKSVAASLVNLTTFEIDKLTPDQLAVIKNTVAKGTTDTELQWFLYQAQVYRLNPLTKEIWCIKQKEHLVIMASRDGLYNKACENANFGGIQSMEVRENDTFEMGTDDNGNLKVLSHRFTQKDRGQITGAWARVRYADGTEDYNYVTYSEYRKDTNTWSKNPTAMIKVRAESPLLRKAGKLNGVYSPEEIEVEATTGQFEEQTVREGAIEETIKKISDVKTKEEFQAVMQEIQKDAAGYLEAEKERIREVGMQKLAELNAHKEAPKETLPPNPTDDESGNTGDNKPTDPKGSVEGA